MTERREWLHLFGAICSPVFLNGTISPSSQRTLAMRKAKDLWEFWQNYRSHGFFKRGDGGSWTERTTCQAVGTLFKEQMHLLKVGNSSALAKKARIMFGSETTVVTSPLQDFQVITRKLHASFLNPLPHQDFETAAISPFHFLLLIFSSPLSPAPLSMMQGGEGGKHSRTLINATSM